MGFGLDCFEMVDAGRAGMLQASRVLASHKLFPLAAPEWMVSQYHVVRATPKLLSHAILACQERPGQAFASKLEDYLVAKLFDEKGHDVLLLQDLERLGKKRDEIEGPADPDITAMVGSQYFRVDFEHPASFLGYVALLEAFPLTLEQVDAFGERAGIPPESLSCMRLHAEADVGHREDLAAILDVVPQSLRPAIVANAQQCAEWQRQAIISLTRRLDRFQKDALPKEIAHAA